VFLLELFKRLLIAFDGSNYSVKALEYACRLAKALGSSVRLVMVIDTARVHVLLYDIMVIKDEEVRERAEKIVKKTLENIRVEYPGIDISYSIRKGHPVEEIIREINEWKPDLLILGPKGTTDLKEVELGSVAETLIERVPIPVLVVK